MIKTVDANLVLNPSSEAKICLFCDKKKCKSNCKRVRTQLKELRDKKKKFTEDK